jgi:hypothetical protein
MIVHQQLAALAGGKSSKKLLGDLPVPMDEGDPSFNPNHPNSISTKKKRTKKLKKEPLKRAVVPTTVAPPTKKLSSK